MKHVSALLMSAVMVLGLVACNAGEDFEDAVVGGPVRDTRPRPAPIPAPDQPAVEIELVVGIERGGQIRPANIANLTYKCTESVGVISATSSRPYIARCATTADRIEFFVGGQTMDARRISLGTAYLPLCTGRSTRSTGSGCGGGAGYFQVTLADIIPARDTDLEPKPFSAPARRAASDDEVRNLSAFLAALDNGSSATALTIRDEAINQAGSAPVTSFTGTYPEFSAYWSGWLTTIGATLPTDADAQEMVRVAADRSRVGLYALEHNGITYGAIFPGDPSNLNVILPFMVFPDAADGSEDGSAAVVGVGAVQAAVTGESSTDATVDVLALDAGMRLNEELALTTASATPWLAKSVLNPVRAELSFTGRILGAAAYDNITTTLDRNDYKLDFPSELVYVMKSSDEARFSGSVDFGGTTGVRNYVERPFRIARTGYVAVNLNSSLLGEVAGFYRLTLFKACVEDNAACQAIPEEEIGPGLNYPAFIDNDNCDDRNEREEFNPDFGLCDDDDVAVDVVDERPRGGAGYAFAETFNIQILTSGTIVTDRGGQCRALNAGTLERDDGLGGEQQEYRIGYVTRTTPGDPEGDITTDSVNVLIFMAGANDKAAEIPHYGTQIQGRINLDGSQMPMYRLGDDNYLDGIRAFWQDFYQAALFAEGESDFSGVTGHRVKALQSGAVQSVRLNGAEGACVPVAP